MKAARPAVFFLCAAFLTLAGCQDVFRSTMPAGTHKPAESAAAPRYTVTFDAGEGSVSPDPVPVPSGSSLGFLPEEPTKEGHTFGHWYTSEGGKEEPFIGSTPVTADITVHAKWLTKAYTVMFDAAGGSVSSQFQSVDHNTPLGVLLPTPARSGHTFGGWYTAANGGTQFTADTTVTTDITVYARWIPQYTVTFDADGGDPVPPSQTVNHGDVINPLPEPAKTGHTFVGWFPNPDGGGDRFTASTAVTGHMIVYARWTINPYTVTFDAGEGSVSPQPQAADYNTPLGSLPEPAKTGYTFGGWYTGQNGGGTQFTASTPVTESKTVYARWIPQYTVTFDTNGGSAAPPPVPVTGGLSIGSLPVAPTKEGHTFGGWYTAANGGGTPFTASTAVTADITVHAKWLINAYTVTFDAGEGGIVSPGFQAADHNTTLGAFLPTPTKEGHTFGGWYTGQDGGGTEFTKDTKVTGNMTVYAKWTPTEHTVTFNAGEGSVSPSAQTVNYNTSLGVLLPTPTKTEHTFDGWFPNANGTGTPFTAATLVTADITVYARWTIKTYTVTFNAAGGDPATQTRRVNYDSWISPLPTPTRTDHTFGGWYTAANGGGDPFTVSTAVTAGITVYAKWLATVRFDTDGGSAAPPPVTVAIGSSMHSLPKAPTKEGYTFGGWYTDRNGGGEPFTASTTVTESKTVYAKWTIKTYTVTFNAGEGSPATQTQTVPHGNKIDLPLAPSRAGYIFGEWNTAVDGGGTRFNADTPVTKNMTFYANWLVPNFSSLQAFINWLKLYTENNGNYAYTLKADESIAPAALSCGGNTVRLTLKGDQAERTVSLNSNGSLFTVGSGVTLVLDHNVTLLGRDTNNASLVTVRGGSLEMKTGSKIHGNAAPEGGGVYVDNGAFTMSGGTITGNTATSHGGGVELCNNSTFTMSGGTISGNTGGNFGGGVDVYRGAFTMSGGTISGNTAYFGGGVFLYNNGTFTKQGGIIYGSDADDGLRNTAHDDNCGHAVFVNVSPGTIRNTTAGLGVTLNSTKNGAAGGWEQP
ncbi:MAG: InlB B-repeat-containing protein [Treponema sp.]|nr:InlB B-repeat-containing protein [Treponema sp.]